MPEPRASSRSRRSMKIGGDVAGDSRTGPHEPYKQFCLDKKDERLEELLIVVSNSEVNRGAELPFRYPEAGADADQHVERRLLAVAGRGVERDQPAASPVRRLARQRPSARCSGRRGRPARPDRLRTRRRRQRQRRYDDHRRLHDDDASVRGASSIAASATSACRSPTARSTSTSTSTSASARSAASRRIAS